MTETLTLAKIKQAFGASLIEAHSQLGHDTVVISKSAILDVARMLKTDPELQYNYLMDLTAVDYWKRNPRFEVVYHLYSLANNQRLRVKAPLGGNEPEIDSLTSLWAGANWFEREVYDMFGIRFKGHPDLRRILLYPEFEGHPLRKDYPITKRQPLIGPKV
ncbi:MAG: NADH-quinone oxidoreductase subunit C [Acidobacteria bacterium]|nr:NADH-quinone oxidoreductase subunit C [Acidobacteriota bacterium]